MKHHYWTWPIAIYLFLGGLGGGILCISMISTLLISPYLELALMWPVCIAILCLGFGCFFLVFELGQPTVFTRVFLTKTSIIKWGAVLLSIAMFAALFWVLPYFPWQWCQAFVGMHTVCMVIAGICGTCIMIYTGVLLASLKAHSFWSTPALPVLFTVSALSTACAAISLSVGAWPDTWPGGITDSQITLYQHALVHSFDIILIVIEIAVLIIYVLLLLGAGNTTAHQVAHRWVVGKTAPLFWFGMVLCGLVIPFCLYQTGSDIAYVISAVLVLCGGLLLRFMIIFADDRRQIPGENRYYARIAKSDAAFLTAWKDKGNLY